MEDNNQKGIVLVPYVLILNKTTINSETVWYRNKWKNFLLKIKHFFITPDYIKNNTLRRLSEKKINSSFYQTIKLSGSKEITNGKRNT